MHYSATSGTLFTVHKMSQFAMVSIFFQNQIEPAFCPGLDQHCHLALLAPNSITSRVHSLTLNRTKTSTRRDDDCLIMRPWLNMHRLCWRRKKFRLRQTCWGKNDSSDGHRRRLQWSSSEEMGKKSRLLLLLRLLWRQARVFFSRQIRGSINLSLHFWAWARAQAFFSKPKTSPKIIKIRKRDRHYLISKPNPSFFGMSHQPNQKYK